MATSDEELDQLLDDPAFSTLLNHSSWSLIEPMNKSDKHALLQQLILKEVIIHHEVNLKALSVGVYRFWDCVIFWSFTHNLFSLCSLLGLKLRSFQHNSSEMQSHQLVQLTAQTKQQFIIISWPCSLFLKEYAACCIECTLHVFLLIRFCF